MSVAITRVGGALLELIAPTSEQASFAKFLNERGPGMHHVAYEVADVEAAVAELAASGAALTGPRPRRGMFGLEVAFVHPGSVHGVLSEVVSGG
jgi:methylmalonyl-CoA/ethylmalonyl-CoA epimerase